MSLPDQHGGESFVGGGIVVPENLDELMELEDRAKRLDFDKLHAEIDRLVVDPPGAPKDSYHSISKPEGEARIYVSRQRQGKAGPLNRVIINDYEPKPNDELAVMSIQVFDFLVFKNWERIPFIRSRASVVRTDEGMLSLHSPQRTPPIITWSGSQWEVRGGPNYPRLVLDTGSQSEPERIDHRIRAKGLVGILSRLDEHTNIA